MNTQKCLHGDDKYRFQDIRMNFSSNIFSHADLSGLYEFLTCKMVATASYPEPNSARLEALIARHEGIEAECVMAGNGATELIYLIGETMRGETFITHQPTFAEYERASLLAGMVPQDSCRAPFGMENSAEDDALAAFSSLEWICNPNNPDGSVWDKAELLQHIDNHPDRLFALDASYEDYTLAPLPSTADLLERRNVITLHSMTKRYCIPGLRLGYATAKPELLLSLRKRQQPWSVNAFAQIAGEYLLGNNVCVLPPMEDYLDKARRLQDAINGIEGFAAMPSQTNFFLCTCQRMTATCLKEKLALDHGILIRDASNFPTLTPHHFRIAAQNDEDNAQLINALASLNT